VSDLTGKPSCAFNIRANGKKAARGTTPNIDIQSKTDKDGIDIIIKPGTKHEAVYIPVVMDKSGLSECVYNDFYIGEGSDVTIVAGCGIHNDGCGDSQHDGIHTFYVGKNARARYVERHFGEGDGTGGRILNQQTVVKLEEGAYMEIETTQIRGVDSTVRDTQGVVGDGATLIIHEKLLTHGEQYAVAKFRVDLDGKDSHTNVISRSVATGKSHQEFISQINGNNASYGHSECDAILMDEGQVMARPEINANCLDSSLVHEAAIGKIAGEQLTKLQTLGLTEKEAEEQIVNGFLK
jgi:Fe-S cluster assembly scaffold protein SufB